MRAPWFTRLAAILGGSVLLSSCGGNATAPPITAKSIAVVTGNAQTGPGGEDLPDSLRVRVMGSNGAALAGATVTWAVTAGGATVSPLTSTTSASGEAAAVLSLGPIGPVTATATVSALAPATFTATSADPCGWLHAFGLGQTVTGRLRQYDCQLGDNSFIDFYRFAVSSQQAVGVRLASSPAFDAYLWFFTAAGPLVGVNDDTTTGANTNSFFKIVAAPGDYIVGANSFSAGETGPYTLSAATTSQSEENCEEVWLTRGVTTTQALSTTDCVATGPSYSDAYWIVLYSGDSLDVTATTPAFDAQLQLNTLNGDGSLAPVAADDSVGGTHLTYTAAVSNFYLLKTSAMTAGGTGAYTLTLAPPVSAAAIRAPRLPLGSELLPKLARGRAKR